MAAVIFPDAAKRETSLHGSTPLVVSHVPIPLPSARQLDRVFSELRC